MLVLCTLIWGGTFPAIKIALEDSSPLLLVAVRFTLAALLFLPLFFREVRGAGLREVRTGLVLGLFLVAGYGLQTIGLNYTSVARSAFLTQLLVVFTPGLQLLLFRKRPLWTSAAGAIVVVLGMFYLTSPDGNVGLNYGDALTLGCALGFALYILFIDRHSRPENRKALCFYQTFFLAIAAWICTVLADATAIEPMRFAYSHAWLLMLLYLAPLGANVVVYIQMAFQPQTTAPRAAVIYSLEPVFATLIALALLMEDWNVRMGLGAAVILAGILLSELGGAWSSGRDPEPDRSEATTKERADQDDASRTNVS